jgi:hypothetical protein
MTPFREPADPGEKPSVIHTRRCPPIGPPGLPSSNAAAPASYTTSRDATAPLVLHASMAACAAQTKVPKPLTEVTATEKICQLTGDVDWETGRPIPGRTLTNFGLGGTDLGYPAEHAGN